MSDAELQTQNDPVEKPALCILQPSCGGTVAFLPCPALYQPKGRVGNSEKYMVMALVMLVRSTSKRV